MGWLRRTRIVSLLLVICIEAGITDRWLVAGGTPKPETTSGLAPELAGDVNVDLVFTPIAPCRVVDTRLAGGVLAPGVLRNFRVTDSNFLSQGGIAGSCGVPLNAAAVAINLVAVSPAGPGHLVAFAFNSPAPLASVLNYTGSSGSLANGLILPICRAGVAACASDISIVAAVSATELVADVTGYFRGFDSDTFLQKTFVDLIVPGISDPPNATSLFNFIPLTTGPLLLHARGWCNVSTDSNAANVVSLCVALAGETDCVGSAASHGLMATPGGSGTFRLGWTSDRVITGVAGVSNSALVMAKRTGGVGDVNCFGSLTVLGGLF